MTIEETLKGYLEEITREHLEITLKSIRKELKQDIRSYVDRAVDDRPPSTSIQERHGERWTPTEDRDLNRDLSLFIKAQAKNHGRSEEAIKLRIHKQRLLW